jgi:hypothetical protein
MCIYLSLHVKDPVEALKNKAVNVWSVEQTAYIRKCDVRIG